MARRRIALTSCCAAKARPPSSSTEARARGMNKPAERPANHCFGSGPTARRPGWSVAALEDARVGRSHRGQEAKARLADLLERSARLLGLPADYRIGLVPGSDTGAF